MHGKNRILFYQEAMKNNENKILFGKTTIMGWNKNELNPFDYGFSIDDVLLLLEIKI